MIFFSSPDLYLQKGPPVVYWIPVDNLILFDKFLFLRFSKLLDWNIRPTRRIMKSQHKIFVFDQFSLKPLKWHGLVEKPSSVDIISNSVHYIQYKSALILITDNKHFFFVLFIEIS